MKTLLILILFISSTAHADDWTKADTTRESIYLTMHTIDWLQTRNISKATPQCIYYLEGKSCTDVHETNPLLGKHPSITQVNQYFIATAAIQFVVSYYLPADYRSAFQYLSIGHDFGYVTHNFSIGISAGF